MQEGKDSEKVSDSDSEEEEEPLLKYQRLKGDFSNVLKRFNLTCFSVCPSSNRVAIGTKEGYVVVFASSGEEIERYSANSSKISAISVVTDHVASCSDDGTVSIKNLTHDKNDLSIFEFSDPIHSLCLDPRYDTSKAFCVGVGEKLIINRKGWLGNTSTIVHQGEGVVSTVTWRQNLLAWCTEKSVKIYDTEKEVRVSSLNRPKSETCYIKWESSKHLLVGWSDTIKLIQISLRRLQSGHTHLYAEIVRMFKTPYHIYGLAPWGKKSIAVLAMGRDDDDDEEEDSVELSELHIISRDSGEEVSSDLLELRGFEHYDKTDYSLHHISKTLYVVASKDVVLAKPRNITDRIRWLLKRNRFETILSILTDTSNSNVPTTLKSQFAESYMSELVSSKNWTRAASFCSDLVSMSCNVKNDNEKGKLWEKWISVFAKHRKLDKIAMHVPTSSPQLPKYVYEMILNEYLATSNIEGLLKILREWVVEDGENIFDLQKVILKTRTMLKTVKIVDENTKRRAVLLSETLAMLYRAAGEHNNALRIHLTSPEPPSVPRNVFAMLETHNLLGDSLEENLGPLLRLDTEETLRLMIRNLDKIPVERAVRHLSHDSEIQMKYLHMLFQTKRSTYNNQSSYGKYHEMQIRLYIKHNPSLLLPFLRKSRHYSLSRALEMCSSHENPPLTRETAYVLSRMGKSKDAMKHLVKNATCRDAIEFVKSCEDQEELWEFMLNLALRPESLRDGAKLLSELLVEPSGIDPVRLVERIPDDLVIPDLNEKLTKILRRSASNVKLLSIFKRIQERDMSTLLHRYHQIQGQGIRVTCDRICPVCRSPVMSSSKDLVVFFNGTAYHASCLQGFLGNSYGGPRPYSAE